MYKLSLIENNASLNLAAPTHQPYQLESPATDLFVDFAAESPVYIDAAYSASQAVELLRAAGLRRLMVVGPKKQFLGVVDFAKLNGQEIIKKISNGYRRDELTVADFLEPSSKLKAFSYQDIAKAKLADVLHTLVSSGLQYCLVVDTETKQIRGIISARDISAKLGLAETLADEPSFNDFVAQAGRAYRQSPEPLRTIN